MILTFTFFGDTFLDLVTITYSALILILVLNVFSELHKIKLTTLAAMISTLAIYLFGL